MYVLMSPKRPFSSCVCVCDFTYHSPTLQVGYDMTKKAAAAVYAKSGHTPQEVDVVELHDCFSANELITYEGLGLCPEGDAL